MFTTLAKKIFGSKNERELKALDPMVRAINEVEPAVQELTNEQMRAKTEELKQRFVDGETLEDLLPEAFALVREASVRTL